MADKINRRDFMTTAAGAGILAAARPLSGASGPAVIVQGSVKPVVVSSGNGHRFKNGGPQTCVETRLRADDEGHRCARCPHRRREHRRTRSGRHERRIRRVAECGRRRATRCLVHARPAQARRRRGRARGREDAVARRQSGPRADGSSFDRRQGRADVRPQHGLRDPAGPQHAPVARGVARVEEADRSHAVDQGSRRPRGRRAEDHARHGGGRVDRREPHLRHHQLQRRQRQRRGVRRDDDERSGVEDPGPSRRFPDSRRGALCRWRGRGGRVDGPRRGESVRTLFLPDRRGDAARQAPEGRRPRGVPSNQGQHDRAASPQQAGVAELQRQLLHHQQERRLCGRGVVRQRAIRGVRREGAAAGAVRTAAAGRSELG